MVGSNLLPTNKTEHALSFRRQVAARLFEFDAFISYKRADARPYAEALWIALEARGMTVAWDGFDVPAGGGLDQALCDRVGNSRCVVFVDTPLARL